ncbi:S-formylglutathione hydrolase [Frankliniella fusca]|uniref:S-formylglutathione hydrolase n=1 Tax=Frankliniella fusca TaxID=407009 RepID=A0AAE1LNZ9_9NEOP|nr:S-formylglutathione hydrolase [Frankliniella fusca]
MSLTEKSSSKSFGGVQKTFSHDSKEVGCKMNFAIYLPPQAEDTKVPLIFWLSGLECNEQNFITKAGGQRAAAEFGVAIVCPDTSPRNMGGHGALICALKNPGKYKSVSAFAPICNPTEIPWGQKAFSGYLGGDKDQWAKYDATLLLKNYAGPPMDILIDQGMSDPFLEKLLPENFVKACQAVNMPVVLQKREGYDHGYYFIATFIYDHIRHHYQYLKA